MTGRASVFSNPLVIRMVSEQFIPVAEDVSGLQQSDDEKGRFFRHVAVQGRMKGRSRPGVSHQGIYAFAADGTSMASANPLDADGTLALLHEAIARWSDYRRDDARAGAPGLGQTSTGTNVGYPEAGMVLRESVRDLPRPASAPLPEGLERHANQWNFDFVWLRSRDVRAFVPDTFEPGAERVVPGDLLTRIARFHLRDIVRGEPRVWTPGSVQRAELTSRVADRQDDRVTLYLTGSVLLREHVAFHDAHKPRDWVFDNELDATITGEAVWNVNTGVFERFDLLVAGQRTGAHRYNVRTHDPGPAPIGFSFELAGNAPWERTPPHAIRAWPSVGETAPPVAITVTGEPYYG